MLGSFSIAGCVGRPVGVWGLWQRDRIVIEMQQQPCCSSGSTRSGCAHETMTIHFSNSSKRSLFSLSGVADVVWLPELETLLLLDDPARFQLSIGLTTPAVRSSSGYSQVSLRRQSLSKQWVGPTGISSPFLSRISIQPSLQRLHISRQSADEVFISLLGSQLEYAFEFLPVEVPSHSSPPASGSESIDVQTLKSTHAATP